MITGETYQPCNPSVTPDRRGFSKLRALELVSLVSRVSSKAGHSGAIERRSGTSRHHGSKISGS